MILSRRNFAWTCPYCGHDTTITSANREADRAVFNIQSRGSMHLLDSERIVCPNPSCERMSITAELHLYGFTGTENGSLGHLDTWRLVPQSAAKVFPGYIPEQIRGDYEEACKIVNLSPRASASMSRRCLQGMIRDFFSIKDKPTLNQEIQAIEENVDPQTWKAIDSVRGMGNIGAHMEKDVNLIIDVDPSEAEQLIWLIESLMKDWYINKHERDVRLEEIVTMSESKQEQRNSSDAS